MRLQYLKLENITSLKGKHFIDFQEISKRSDLFAITGPTGSGKSSLLMAIAMALYGQNHKGLNAADLVTTQCPYGKIELQFSLHAKTYRVLWSCQTLKKDGTPRKVALTQRHWYVDDVEQATDASEVIGLSWDQFTKVIILNQGQFSEFLTSTFNKRKEILEKLMGHGQLEILGKNLRRKLSELDSEIKSLQGQSDFAKIMSEEDFEVLKIKQKRLRGEGQKFHNISQACQVISKKVSEDIHLKEKKLEISQQYSKKLSTQEELQKEMSIVQTQLKNAEGELQLQQKNSKEQRPTLKEAKRNQQEIKSAQIKKDQIEKMLQENALQLETKATLKEECKEKLTSIESTTGKSRESIKVKSDIPSLKEDHKSCLHLLNQIERKWEAYQGLLREREEIEKEGQSNKKAINESIKDKFIKRFSSQEQPHLQTGFIQGLTDLLSSEDFSGLKSKLDDFSEELKHSIEEINSKEEELKSLKIEWDHLKEIQKQNTQRIKDYSEDIRLYNTKKINLVKQVEEAQGELNLIAAENRKWELLKLAYEDLSQENHKEEDHFEDLEGPCPVCSSESISWQKVFAPLNEIGEDGLEKQRQLTQKLKTLTHEQEILEIQSKDTTRKKEDLTKVLSELESNIKDKNKKILQLDKESDSSFTLQEVQALSQALQQQQYEIDHYQIQRAKLIQRWKENDQLIKKSLNEASELAPSFKALTHSLSEFNPTVHQLVGVSTLQLQNVELSDFRDKLDIVGKEIDQEVRKINELKILEEKAKGLRLTLNGLEKDLTNLHSMSKKSKEEDKEITLILTSLMNEASVNKYPNDPDAELEKLENQLEMARSKRDIKSKEKMDIDTRYRQGSEQLNNLKERLEELEKLHFLYIDEIGKKISLLKEQSLQAPFQEDEKLSQELGSAYLTEQSTWLGHLEKYISQKWGDSITRESFQIDQQFLFESVQPQSQRIQDFHLALNQKSAAIEQEIKTYNEQQERIAQLSKQINTKKEQWEQFEILNHYIGKDKFRDFALTILENTLLEMANHEIQSLAEGRYELLHAKAGKRSEFMVKDHWHGGNERKVSTLSGGETFLLSLGLAMGLSDITRGQTEIESFFIDEGFGTLDDESIGQVLDCLMAIQSRGKQIGLISHVTSLTSQIPIRLEVTKNNFGESTLNIN